MSAAVTTPDRPEPAEGQVWTRSDPNGTKVEFMILKFSRGPHAGEMQAIGKISNTKRRFLRAPVKLMKTDHVRFQFVHHGVQPDNCNEYVHSDLIKKPDPKEHYEVLRDGEWVRVTNAREVRHYNLLPRLHFYWPDRTWGQVRSPNWRLVRES